MNRLAIALAVFGVLAVLTWTTISDQRLRMATLAILALFALKTWLRRKDVMHSEREQGSDAEESGSLKADG